MSCDSLTQSYLKSILHYDLLTGKFTWKVAPSNKIKIGQEAGYVNMQRNNGYLHIGIKTDKSRMYRAHRLAFLYVLGSFPYDQVDHINGDRSDNRWINLRHASNSLNNHNSGAPRNNTSGVKGVDWHITGKKWRAGIRKDGKYIHLGLFGDIEDAKKAREKAEKLYFP